MKFPRNFATEIWASWDFQGYRISPQVFDNSLSSWNNIVFLFPTKSRQQHLNDLSVLYLEKGKNAIEMSVTYLQQVYLFSQDTRSTAGLYMISIRSTCSAVTATICKQLEIERNVPYTVTSTRVHIMISWSRLVSIAMIAVTGYDGCDRYRQSRVFHENTFPNDRHNMQDTCTGYFYLVFNLLNFAHLFPDFFLSLVNRVWFKY